VFDCRGHSQLLKKEPSLFSSLCPLEIPPMNRGPSETTACWVNAQSGTQLCDWRCWGKCGGMVSLVSVARIPESRRAGPRNVLVFTLKLTDLFEWLNWRKSTVTFSNVQYLVCAVRGSVGSTCKYPCRLIYWLNNLHCLWLCKGNLSASHCRLFPAQKQLCVHRFTEMARWKHLTRLPITHIRTHLDSWTEHLVASL
jgi:hypothetical protein